MLKIFGCAICSHYSHVYNKAISCSQDFQSTHYSSEVAEKIANLQM